MRNQLVNLIGLTIVIIVAVSLIVIYVSGSRINLLPSGINDTDEQNSNELTNATIGPNYTSNVHKLKFSHPGNWGNLIANNQHSQCEIPYNLAGTTEFISFTLQEVIIILFPCAIGDLSGEFTESYQVNAATGQSFTLSIFTLTNNTYSLVATYRDGANLYTDIYIEHEGIAPNELETARMDIENVIRSLEFSY